MWDVIVLIPDHCLSIYFAFIQLGTKMSRNNKGSDYKQIYGYALIYLLFI